VLIEVSDGLNQPNFRCAFGQCSMYPWVIMQPLGSPVVPEVYRMLISVSGSGAGQAGTGSGSTNRSAKLAVPGSASSTPISWTGMPVSLSIAAAMA